MTRIIIYRLGSLGDTVAALPCFHLVERAYPDAERILLTNVPVSRNAPPVEAILRPGGFVHGSIPYPLGVRDPVTIARLAAGLRRRNARTLVYLAERTGILPVRRDVGFFKLCGIRNIIGAPLAADLRHYRAVGDGELEHESHRLGRMLRNLGEIDFADRSWWDLRLTETERTVARRELGEIAAGPFVAVNTGGKIREKDWGVERWTALLRLLGEKLKAWGLVFVGGLDDGRRATRLRAVWSGPANDLCGALSPRETAAALCHADVFIGHDSGPFHLADSVGTPAVGLFGNYNRPKVWHPSGPETCVIHRMAGLATITPAEVGAEVLALLSTKHSFHV